MTRKREKIKSNCYFPPRRQFHLIYFVGSHWISFQFSLELTLLHLTKISPFFFKWPRFSQWPLGSYSDFRRLFPRIWPIIDQWRWRFLKTKKGMLVIPRIATILVKTLLLLVHLRHLLICISHQNPNGNRFEMLQQQQQQSEEEKRAEIRRFLFSSLTACTGHAQPPN